MGEADHRANGDRPLTHRSHCREGDAVKATQTKRRMCPWCGQSERVVSGRWALHVDPNIIPKGSQCDGVGNDYKPRQYVVKHDGLGLVGRGL